MTECPSHLSATLGDTSTSLSQGTMPAYKLYYFPSRGRAEMIRYVFAQAGVEYEDVRVGGEEWGKLKPS